MSRPDLPAQTQSTSKMLKKMLMQNPSVITGIVGGLGMFLHQVRNYEVNRGRVESFSDYMIRSRVLVCATVVGCFVIEGGIKSGHYFYLKSQGKKTVEYHESRIKAKLEQQEAAAEAAQKL